jgi:hypothetical protein
MKPSNIEVKKFHLHDGLSMPLNLLAILCCVASRRPAVSQSSSVAALHHCDDEDEDGHQQERLGEKHERQKLYQST